MPGYSKQDLQIITNQINAWNHLFYLVEQNKLTVSQNVACELHAIAAKEDVLEWGKFRSGQVTIAGTNYQPPNAKRLPKLLKSWLRI